MGKFEALRGQLAPEVISALEDEVLQRDSIMDALDRVANEIRTATGAVVVGTAVAPVAGQVLTALSPILAHWETPAAVVASGQVLISATDTVPAVLDTKLSLVGGLVRTVVGTPNEIYELEVDFGNAAGTACEGDDIRLSDDRNPLAHNLSHEFGGADVLSVAGLSGLLADPQTPDAHTLSHQHLGADEVGVAIPAPNAIPKADGAGTLNAWITAAGNSATRTLADMQFYLDGTAGNDLNDGLTALTAKKTFNSLLPLIPDIIEHRVCINAIGSFEDEPNIVIAKHLQTQGSVLLIDGGATENTLLVEQTTTAANTASLTVAAIGWTVDGWAGKVVRVTGGPASGEMRTIQGNTVDTLTVTEAFSVDPTAGATFVIVEPDTHFINNAATTSIHFSCTGPGTVSMQRMSVRSGTSSTYIYAVDNSAYLKLSGFVMNDGIFGTDTSNRIIFNSDILDTTTFAPVATQVRYSVGMVNMANPVTFINTNIDGLSGFVLKDNSLHIFGCKLIQLLIGGARVSNTVVIDNCALANPMVATLVSWPGYATTLIDNGGGLIIRNSHVIIDNIQSALSSQAGVTLENARLDVWTDVGGATNGGAGVYANSGSLMTSALGSALTITGLVGDLSVADPAIQEETWANIAAGTVVSVATEMTLIKAI